MLIFFVNFCILVLRILAYIDIMYIVRKVKHMRIRTTKTKNTIQYAIIYDVNINGKRTTKSYENLGTLDKIKLRSNGEDPLIWLKKYVEELNKKIKEDSLPVIIKKSPNKRIEKNKHLSFNGGYLFLQDIYYKLKINNICDNI